MMYGYWDRAYHMMNPAGWWSLFNLVAILVIVLLAIFLVRHFLKNRSHTETPLSPLDIAKTRLAKGEITPEEFTAIKEHLNQ
jgi:uncharacterized membrane protein